MATLIHLRHDLPHSVLGLLFGARPVHRHPGDRSGAHALAERGRAVPDRPGLRPRTLTDVFAYAQAEGGRRAFVSGKKKQNTMKATVVADDQGRTSSTTGRSGSVSANQQSAAAHDSAVNPRHHASSSNMQPNSVRPPSGPTGPGRSAARRSSVIMPVIAPSRSGALPVLFSAAALAGVAVPLWYQVRQARIAQEAARRDAHRELIILALGDACSSNWESDFRLGNLGEGALRDMLDSHFVGEIARQHWAAGPRGWIVSAEVSADPMRRHFYETAEERYEHAVATGLPVATSAYFDPAT